MVIDDQEREFLLVMQKRIDEKKELHLQMANTKGSDVDILHRQLKELHDKMESERIAFYGEDPIRPGNMPFDYYEYLKSEDWKLKASIAKGLAGYSCRICSSGVDLQAHHRTYERVGNEEPNDITVLCGRCHAKFHDERINHG